jgi:hypothetical protein
VFPLYWKYVAIGYKTVTKMLTRKAFLRTRNREETQMPLSKAKVTNMLDSTSGSKP